MLSSFTTATLPPVPAARTLSAGAPAAPTLESPADPAALAGESVTAFGDMLAGLQPQGQPTKPAALIPPKPELAAPPETPVNPPVILWHAGRVTAENVSDAVTPETTSGEIEGQVEKEPREEPLKPEMLLMPLFLAPEPPPAPLPVVSTQREEEDGEQLNSSLLPESDLGDENLQARKNLPRERAAPAATPAEVAVSDGSKVIPSKVSVQAKGAVSEFSAPMVEKVDLPQAKVSGLPAQPPAQGVPVIAENVGTAVATPAAQFAARWPQPAVEGTKNSAIKNKNIEQVVVKEVETNVKPEAGTDHANGTARMFTLAPSTLIPTPEVSLGEPSRIASEAARMVERVARTAEMISAQPAEKVQVRIELSDIGVVDVSVAMREGVVHTSFRSDSAEVREALATAWSDFTKGREAARHSWAEPVFAKIDPTPVAAAGAPADSRDLGQSFGQGASFRQQEQATDERRSFVPAQASALPAAAVVATAAPALSGDSSRLLHVLA